MAIDPGAQRKAKKQADKVVKESTFAAVAEEWFSHYCEQRSKGNKPLSQATIIKTQWLLNLVAYRAKQTKADAPHSVRPIRGRAILGELQAVTGPEGLMFPSLTNSTRPMSENAITAALRRMGYSGDGMTRHGFRTIASTLLRELRWGRVDRTPAWARCRERCETSL